MNLSPLAGYRRGEFLEREDARLDSDPAARPSRSRRCRKDSQGPPNRRWSNDWVWACFQEWDYSGESPLNPPDFCGIIFLSTFIHH